MRLLLFYHLVLCILNRLIFSVDYCSDPGSIENGRMEGTGPFSCVSTVKYTCNETHWLLGAETLRCGKYGQWDGGIPSCIDNSKKLIRKTSLNENK